jgi:5'-3' exonuclease
LPNDPAVYLIDASIYVFRAWYLLPDSLEDAEGNPANAVYGFADFLLQLLEREQPRYIACAFDKSRESSVRNEIYPAYKANREPAPEELKVQFKVCRELVRALGMVEYASSRLEADDIIGTLATNTRAKGHSNVIVTADKDLAQLIREGDELWDFARDKRLGVAGIRKKFGVAPHQIPDLLALMGDRIDNIRGVPGIGLKTAARLLIKWEHLDQLYANLDQVGLMKFRGAVRIGVLLHQHRDTVLLARRLTTTLHDPSLPTEAGALERRKVDLGHLKGLFDRIGLGRLRRERWNRVLQTQGSSL